MVKYTLMEPLDTTKLKTFVVIAAEGNFTRAAARLNLTQPTVSQQLATLEKSLGVTLIERRPRQIKLTPAGKTLLAYGERILALCGEAKQRTREVAGKARLTLRVGVGHTLAIYLLPDILHQLHRIQPDVDIRVLAGNTGDLLTATAEGRVELALVGSPAQHPQLDISAFMNDKLVVIVSANDSWVGRASVTLHDVRQRTLLTRERGSALHASVEKLLGENHLTGPQVIILGETEAIKRSVEAELGIALIQGIAVQRELQQGFLHAVPLVGADIRRTYNIARRKRQPLSAPAKLLVELLLKSVQLKYNALVTK